MKGKIAIALVGAIAVLACFAVFSEDPASQALFQPQISYSEALFLKYITEERKQYFNEEEYRFRKAIFESNLALVNEHNSLPDREFDMELNFFADLTEEEKQNYLGIRGHPGQLPEGIQFDAPTAGDVDWRTNGDVVAPIRDQGSCGSCWAFGAVTAAETRCAIKEGTRHDLSEQELVDCAKGKYKNMGCNGGWPHWGYDYQIDQGGLSLRKDYTYTARDGTCKQNNFAKYDKIAGYDFVASNGGKDNLLAAVQSGTVSIAVAANTSFQLYRHGRFTGSCPNSQVNHAVDIVGYRSSDDSFILRNSWGTSWGESGYMYIKPGLCNMYYYMVVPK